MDVMGALQAQQGHIYCGVYAEVTEGGGIRVGDEASLPEAIDAQAAAT
jgi:MOSC domain-containing protein YiiM